MGLISSIARSGGRAWGFLRWLCQQESLPPVNEADLSRSHVRRFLTWLFAAETLPPPPDPDTASAPPKRSFFFYLFQRETLDLADPPPPSKRRSGLLLWLLSRESLEKTNQDLGKV